MSPRTYRQQKRAAQQEETHNRILEATMALHEDLGAAHTSVSAVARKAGVQRLTVYRHFPDEAALLEACTTRWLELHPMPTPADWDGVDDPRERARRAVAAFYSYYRRTEAMWRGAYRDRAIVPALDARMALVDAYLDETAAQLAADHGGDGTTMRSTLRHVLEFGTWSSLAQQGLEDAAAVDLVSSWMDAVTRAG